MTLILSNEEIEEVLEIPDCIEAMERAYLEHSERKAVNRPRTDIYSPHERDDAFYIFKSFEGMLPSAGVVALRINSDVITWSEYAGTVRKDKIPSANGKWVGLVLLFSTVTGEPLAIFPDGVVQRIRVGVSNALAARFMARKDAKIYGLLGAGWQAGAQLMAISAVRELEEVRVYSPNPSSREAFAAEYGEKLDSNVRTVDTAREAMEGADILGTATNAIKPVIEPEWIAAGMHLTCVKHGEMGDEALERCDRVAVHTHEGAPHNYLIGLGDVPVVGHDPLDLAQRLRKGESADPENAEKSSRVEASRLRTSPLLSDLVSGRVPGRESDQEINAFVNNIGLGIQFAAIGELAYRKARERAAGREVPTDWFLETVHP